MEWLFGVALLAVSFAALGLGALIWLSVLEKWRKRNMR